MSSEQIQSGVPINLPDTLEDAERFQRLFVQPLVEAVRTEMQTHLAPVADLTKRVGELEGKQTKALLGWGVYATAASVLIGVSLDWIKKKLHWGDKG